MDRRESNRCPVCDGPAVADAAAPKGVRCRRSTCLHNHTQVKCPRCGHADLESVHFEDKQFSFTCKECTQTWKV